MKKLCFQFIVSFYFLLSITNYSLSQTGWFKQIELSSSQLNSIYFVNKDTGWVVGGHQNGNDREGDIYKTVDGGTSWVLQNHFSPNNYSPNGNLMSVCFANANTGWVGGTYQILLITTDGGNNWNKLVPTYNNNNRPSGYITSNNESVFCPRNNGNFIVVLGNSFGGEILYNKNYNNSNAWTAIPLNNTLTSGISTFNSFSFPPEYGNNWGGDYNYFWVVGDSTKPTQHQNLDFGVIYKCDLNSNFWEYNYSLQSFKFYNIFFSDINNGWVVGEKITDGGPTSIAVILRTIYKGRSWTIGTYSEADYFNKIYFADNNTGWVSGKKGSQMIILKTTNGGTNWHNQTLSQINLADNLISSIYFINCCTGWVVNASGEIFKTISGGEELTPGIVTVFHPYNNEICLPIDTLKVIWMEPEHIQNKNLNYCIEFSKDNSNSKSIFKKYEALTDTSISISGTNLDLSTGTDYWIRVGTKYEGADCYAPYSSWYKFTTGSSLNLISPNSNASCLDTNNIDFSWTPSYDLNNICSIKEYHLIIYKGSAPDVNVAPYIDEIVTVSPDPSINSSTFTQKLNRNTTYCWNVKVINDADSGEYSHWRSFKTVTVPSTVELIYPDNTASCLNPTDIEFKWNPVIDNQCPINKYILTLFEGPTPDFNSSPWLEIPLDYNITNINASSFTRQLDSKKTYCWNVKASNIIETSEFGEWRKFSTTSNLTQGWMKKYHGIDYDLSFLNSMAIDNDGNIYVTGTSTNSINGFDGICTIKYNSSGVFQWVNNYNPNTSISNSYSYGSSIVTDNDGFIYVTGVLRRADDNSDMCTIKYDPGQGSVLWHDEFGQGITYNGVVYDGAWGEDLKLDNDNNIIVTGFVYQQSNDNKILQNSRRFCIRKLNSSGQEVKKDIRDDIVEETKIKFDGSGNIFIKGAKITLTSSNTINATFGFLKYDNTLSHLSSKIFDNMDAFAVDHSGNIYRSQISGSNYYLIKENSVEELWRKNIHNSSGIGEIIVDETGDIYVTSWKLHQDNNNISDIDILKFDASGNQRMDIPMNNYLTGIVLMTIDLCGNIYVTAAKLNDNELDLYTQKFYSNGNLCGSPMVYHNTDFLNHYIQLKDILLDINGNVYVSGSEWNSDHLGLILHEFLTLKYQQ